MPKSFHYGGFAKTDVMALGSARTKVRIQGAGVRAKKIKDDEIAAIEAD